MRRNHLSIVLALGLALPTFASISEARADVTATASRGRNWDRNTESRNWRQGYGAYAGRGRREAINQQRGDTGGVDLALNVGREWESGSVLSGGEELADDTLRGCGAEYDVLSASAEVTAGLDQDGAACNAGVAGTLASGSVDCRYVLAGDANNNVLVRGGAEAGAETTLGCSCSDGGAGVTCEAFIGVRGSINGGLGGTLCGVGLTVNGGLEGGAGAGARAQVGYVEGRGYGLAVGAYLGLGGGGSVYVDPQLGALFEGETWSCLGDTAIAAVNAVGNAIGNAATSIANGVGDALGRLSCLFGCGDGGGDPVRAAGGSGGGGSVLPK